MEYGLDNQEATEGPDERPPPDEDIAYGRRGVLAVAEEARDGLGEEVKLGRGHEAV